MYYNSIQTLHLNNTNILLYYFHFQIYFYISILYPYGLHVYFIQYILKTIFRIKKVSFIISIPTIYS